jgi:hypothetical protein
MQSARRGGTCHPDPALREKDLLFFAPHEEVEDQYFRTPSFGCRSGLKGTRLAPDPGLKRCEETQNERVN